MEQVLQAFIEPILKAIPRLPQAILVLVVGWLAIRFFHWLFSKVLRLAKTPKTLFTILTSMAEVVLSLILIAVVFQSLGLGQIALAISGSVAIIGVALGTGANALVQDVIAGLFLSRDPDFDVGFLIKTGEIEGKIIRIDIRKVRIEDKEGKVYVLPNSSLDRASWVVIDRKSK